MKNEHEKREKAIRDEMSRRASIETNEENPKLPIAKEEIHQPMVTIGVMTKVESWLT